MRVYYKWLFKYVEVNLNINDRWCGCYGNDLQRLLYLTLMTI